MISFTGAGLGGGGGGGPQRKIQNTLISPWPNHSPESCQSFLKNIFGIKQKKTSQLLFLFTFFTFTTLHYDSIKVKTTLWLVLWESPLQSQHLSRHQSSTILSSPSSYTSLHTASISFLLSNENNSWVIVLGWLIGALHTAGGLSMYRRSHLCWVGLQLTAISSTDTSPALHWGMCCVISRLKQTTLLGSFALGKILTTILTIETFAVFGYKKY